MSITKKIFVFGLIAFFCLVNITPVIAEKKPGDYGDECFNWIVGDDCESSGCEEAEYQDGTDTGHYFCDCGNAAFFGSIDDSYCAKKFGSSQYPNESWECKDGVATSYDLDYCLGSNQGAFYPDVAEKIKAIDPEKFNQTQISETGTLLNELDRARKETPLTKDEIAALLKKPSVKIAIPGLNFSDLDISGKLSAEPGTTQSSFLYVPFLGEYVSTIYNYSMIVVGVIAVVIFIIAGIRWILTGSGEHKAAILKSMKGAMIGILLLAGSYTILYALNPALVKFESLKVLFVRELPMQENQEADNSNLVSANFISGPGQKILDCNAEVTYEKDIGRCHIVAEDNFPTGWDLSKFSDGRKSGKINIGQCLIKKFLPGLETDGISAFAKTRKYMKDFAGIGSVTVNKLAYDKFHAISEEIKALKGSDPVVDKWLEYAYTAGAFVSTKGTGSTYKQCNQPGKETWVVVNSTETKMWRSPTTILKNICGNHSDAVYGSSMHGLGLAIDVATVVNWDLRPVCRGGKTHKHCDGKKPKTMHTDIPKKIVDVFYKHGFSWLGATAQVDAMHFQYFGNECFLDIAGGAKMETKYKKYPPGTGCCAVVKNETKELWRKNWSGKGTTQIPTYEECMNLGGAKETNYTECLDKVPEGLWVKKCYKCDS